MFSVLRYLAAWGVRILPVSVVTQATTSRKFTASSLPDEMWTLIVMELALEDVLKLRLVCQHMNGISASRMVWRQIFLRSLGSRIPKPFFLDKPLKQCSSKEIESALRGWRTGWTPTNPLQCFLRPVDKTSLDGEQLCLDTMIVAPGGRWAIAASRTGSVWWFDLSDDWTSTSPAEPRLLAASKLATSDSIPESLQIMLAADFLSEESLGPSSGGHHLSQFNIAIITRPAGPSSSSCARVAVWRIRVSEESGGCGLKLGECLSAYEETGAAKLTGFSLHGSAVACGMDTGGDHGITCVIIVDWAEVNGKTLHDEIIRHYIAVYPASKVMLLPGDRILLVHENNFIDIFNWRKDCQPSKVQPSEQEDTEHVDPIWTLEEELFKLGAVQRKAMVDPVIMFDAIHIVVPTPHEIFGITIPLDDADGHSIRSQLLFEGDFHGHGNFQVFGHKQAVGTRDVGITLFAAQYHWQHPAASDDESSDEECAEDTTRFTELTFPEGALKEQAMFRILYDPFSRRVIVGNEEYISQIVTLQNSRIDPHL